MSDEESDDEHDENGKNEFEDIEEAAFLNPFGTLRIECIYSFALHHENCNEGNGTHTACFEATLKIR